MELRGTSSLVRDRTAGGAVARVPRTVVCFVAVGLVNTAIDLVLFAVLAAPLGIVVGNFVSTSAGMTFSFIVNGRHTFGAQRRTLRQAVLFVASNGATMWILQPVLIHATYDVAAVPLLVAKVVALGGSVVANFLLYRYLVWRPSSASRGTRGPRHERGLSKPTAEPAKP
jgi:putative flippase GtrA